MSRSAPHHYKHHLNGTSNHQRRWPAYALTALASGGISILLARNFFESEKKIVKPIITDYGVCDAEFERTISHLLGPPLVEGNHIEILEDGSEIFPAMLAAISTAKHSITMENFVFTSGNVSQHFAHALAAKAQQGVKVHFLQDAIGCNCLHGEEIKLMKDAGVEVEIFRYINLRFNERTHRKILIIDGAIGFIGGVGLSDEWEGEGNDPDHWHDTQYRIEGPVVAQLQQAFMDNWIQTRAEVLHGDLYFPSLPNCGNLRCQAFKSSACEGADSARLMFLFSIAAARESICIGNAYFIPDDLLVETLVRAAHRGVRVEVIVPGALTDRQIVRHTGAARWGKLLRAGVRIYEYQPARYHCKYMIVDNHWTSVGSCNFDNRSLRLNEEANLNILDNDFALQHRELFERDRSNSIEITYDAWRQRPMHEKIKGLLGCLLRSQL